MSTVQSIPSVAKLDLRKVAGNIGAEVRGLQLSGDLDPTAVQALKEALWQHKVLFVRGQSHVDDVLHEKIARLFGEIHDHPTQPNKAGTHITELDSRRKENANFWHTDQSFQDTPPAMAFLRSITVPEYGGDTMWANCARAYERLPDHLRALADLLSVVHTNDREDIDYITGFNAMKAPFTSTIYETEHPLVRVHPESGERVLYLGSYAHKFIGANGYDSQALFRIFMDAILKPENIVRWSWQPGDFVIWDERATLHYAILDYDQPRVMRRVTVKGAMPVGIDGKPGTMHVKVPNPIQAQIRERAEAAAG